MRVSRSTLDNRVRGSSYHETSVSCADSAFEKGAFGEPLSLQTAEMISSYTVL